MLVYKGKITKPVDTASGARLYISPREMKPKGSKSPWNYSKLKEFKVFGINTNDFRFYKYKKGSGLV